MTIEYIQPYPYTCGKCGKPYGKTTLSYRGIEVWVGCDCHPKEIIYFLNTENITHEKESAEKTAWEVGSGTKERSPIERQG